MIGIPNIAATAIRTTPHPTRSAAGGEAALTQPPVVAVAKAAIRVGVHLGVRGGQVGDPFRRNDLAAVPEATSEHELPDPGQVGQGEAQAGCGKGDSLLVLFPFEPGDPERTKELLFGVPLEGCPGGAHQDGGSNGHVAPAVTEALTGRGHDLLAQNVAVAVRGEVHRRLAVPGIGVGPGGLVPGQARGHREEVAQADLHALGRAQVGVLREVVEHRPVQAGQLPLRLGNPVEQGDHALGDGADVVEPGSVEGHFAARLSRTSSVPVKYHSIRGLPS